MGEHELPWWIRVDESKKMGHEGSTSKECMEGLHRRIKFWGTISENLLSSFTDCFRNKVC